ncbi:Svep1 [Scenedesmus sp. PABB004]|nr:Svep1 [Scenedesmus sp. PABB004]
MARRAGGMVAAALLLALALGPAVALGGEQQSAAPGRRLQQRPLACTAVHRACRSCRAQRIPGTRRTEVLCSVCEAGWRLRRDGIGKTCDCAPGMALNGSASDAGAWCAACPAGQFCPGGDRNNPSSAPRDCAAGLATMSAGAKSEAQCFTTPGFGRVAQRQANGAVALVAQRCAVGSYNVGRNTAGCQRCNPGLTTVTEGAAAMSDCVAPPGSYYDRGMGRLCPRGTFSTNFTAGDASCTPCAPGVTTAAEGSNSSDACGLAARGFHMSGPGVAAACPVDTYSDVESANTECTPCPSGLRTLDEASTGVALCLMPPGMELAANATVITECAIGFYKEGWNRNPCVPCGAGVVTAETGSVGRDACLVPAGWGLASYFPLTAKPCTNNTYGDDVPRAAVSNARCLPCTPGMYTRDVLDNALAPAGYSSEQECLVPPGWGTTTTDQVQRCDPGTFNPGRNREPCQPCATGFTTLAPGATSSDACVVQPGWAVDPGAGVPLPCNVGTYSVGGTADSPGGACVACPAGFTTQSQEATALSDCDLCKPGYGGDACGVCGYNTYSPGTAAGEPCQPCAAGSVSARLSAAQEQCVADMQQLDGDVLSLSDAGAWANSSAGSASACSTACGGAADCVMYRWSGDSGGACQLLLANPGASPAQQWGFKLPLGYDFSLYTLPAGLTAGRLVSTLPDVSLEACMQTCALSGSCELVSFPSGVSSGLCRLWDSELDPVWVSMWHVTGASLYSDRGM